MHATIERGAFAIGSEIVRECPCDCHGPCALCGAYGGEHDAGCMGAPAAAYFTPQERASLTMLKRHAERDRRDNAPMVNVTYDAMTGDRIERVIPWGEAIALDISSL
jgi:hypothetical protein